MTHFKFTPKQPWKGNALPMYKYMVMALKPYKRDLKRRSVSVYKQELWMERFARKLNRRMPIGVIRAFGHTHYFAGCYIGAEND